MIRFIFLMLFSCALSCSASAQKAKALKKAPWDRASAYTIKDNRGGVIEYYQEFYQALAKSGMNVVVDGPCFSGCTFVLIYVPRNRICVTENAAFAFHAAIDRPRGEPKHYGVINEAATEWMYNNYPKDIIAHIDANGGLDREWVELDTVELQKLVQRCR